MKKLTLLAFILLNMGFAFSQASSFYEDYSEQPVCPNGHEYYRIADKYRDGRAIKWEVENGEIIGSDLNPEVTVKWNNVQMTNGSMPQGTLRFYYYDEQSKTWIPNPLQIPIISAKGVSIDVLINGNRNPDPIPIPYKETRRLIGEVRPPSGQSNIVYPNTNIIISTFEWTLSSGVTSPGNSSPFIASNSQIPIDVDGCAASPKIQVRAIEHYCNNDPGTVREVQITRSFPATTTLTSTVDAVQWGTPRYITFTTSSVLPPDNYEWTISGGFDGGSRTITTTAPNITLNHKGCENGIVSVRAVYCNGRKSNPVSKTISVQKPSMYITGPAVIVEPTEYIVENLPEDATVSWTGGNCIHFQAFHIQSVPTQLMFGPIASDPKEKNDTITQQPTKYLATCHCDDGCIESLVRATISYSGCSIVLDKDVYVGVPPNIHAVGSRYNNDYISPSKFCRYIDVITLNHNPNGPGIIEGEWQRVGQYGPINSIHSFLDPESNYGVWGSTLTFDDMYFNRNGEAFMQARLANHCGWSGWADIVYHKGNTCTGDDDGGGGIRPKLKIVYSPNPTTDEVKVEFEELPTMESQSEIYSVKILDASGVTLRQKEFRHRYEEGIEPVRFNTSSLRKGTYFLHVEGGGELVREQIVVSK
jgi:hypothetical protein